MLRAAASAMWFRDRSRVSLARRITEQIPIPTIGIGASAACDGQILVLEDMLGLSPRVPANPPQYLRLSGLEPLVVGPDSLFVNVGERTNVTGSARFRRLITDGNYEEALQIASVLLLGAVGDLLGLHYEAGQEHFQLGAVLADVLLPFGIPPPDVGRPTGLSHALKRRSTGCVHRKHHRNLVPEVLWADRRVILRLIDPLQPHRQTEDQQTERDDPEQRAEQQQPPPPRAVGLLLTALRLRGREASA